MDSIRCPRRRCAGYSLIIALPMAALLLFCSLAYLKWQVDAQLGARHQVAVTKAYYLAQAAGIQVPLSYMRTLRPTSVPTAVVAFPDGWISGLGRYLRPLIRCASLQDDSLMTGFLTITKDYLLSATGVVEYNDFNGKRHEVRRAAVMRLRRQSLARYFYVTEIEQTRFGEFIWFWKQDTLTGPVFSNSDIGIRPGAVFYYRVYSGGRIRDPQGSSFYRGYIEHCQKIDFSPMAEYLRASAASNGLWLNTNHFTYTYGLELNGGSAYLWQWRIGMPSPFGDRNVATVQPLGSGGDYAIFCDGDLWLKGHTNGRVGIGAEGNLRLMSDVYLTGFEYPWDEPTLSTVGMITLISEAHEPPLNDRTAPWTGILIANTPENGREGGRATPLTNQATRDIAIYAQLLALNSSVTFEDQNDIWDAYRCPIPNQYGTSNDERGVIFLRGAVVQKRRGYVHRSNLGGTGYTKGYIWDARIREGVNPPFRIDLTSQGFAKWDLLGWMDAPRKAGDERNE